MSKKLKEILFVTSLILICTCAAAGQESRCILKLADLPFTSEFRGFRVGMTVEQIKVRLPNLRVRQADEFGFTSLNIFPDYETGIDKTAFEGVRSVSLDVLDGSVFSIWIGYDKTFKWQTIDEYVTGITTALKLSNSWQPKFRTRLLDCFDFTIAVIPVGESPSIKLIDKVSRESLDKRQTAKEEAQP